jgi:hypothetical protein
MEAFAQQRTWERARRLGLSLLACLGRHTLTGWLSACGRQFLDWSADYKLFSQYRWEADDLFAPVVREILSELPAGAPFVSALDDTHLRKTGGKIPGVSYQRDPLSPPFHTNFIRAQRFLQLSGMLYSAGLATAARSIPIRYQHVPPVPKPKHSAPPEDWKAYRKRRRIENLSTRAVALLLQTRGELDHRHGAANRPLIVGTDGSYTNKTLLRGRPERTTLIGRIRKDATLFYPPTEADQPAVGAKRKYGRPAPTPEELHRDERVAWQELRAFASGQERTFRLKTVGPVLWRKAGADCPLRLVAIAPVGYRLRKGSKLLYRQPAYLVCTDPDLPLQAVVQYYIWRWDIEVNHRDEKQILGVGEAQVRSPNSVQRLPAFAVASYAMLLLAGTHAFGTDPTPGTLPQPKWRTGRCKQRLSSEDLVQQLRSEVWAHALNTLGMDSGHFVSTAPADMKSPEFDLPLASAALYCHKG